MKRTRLSVTLGALAATLSLIAVASPASAHGWHHHGPGHPGHEQTLAAAPPLPAHFAAPYVDVTEVSDLAAASRESGSRYLSLAFLQTEKPGSCTVYWAGDTDRPVSTTGIGAQIAQIRRQGGDVVPSFGGYAADTTGTELADSCTDVSKLAAEYERVVTVLGVHRLDFDIEADAINDQAGIDRRNAAIVRVERWAHRHHRSLDIVYTLPSTPQGLAANGMGVLDSAVAHHAPVAGVNVMTFDYYDEVDGLPVHDMVADAETAVAGLTKQMRETIAPHESARRIRSRISVTQMNGIDDYGTQETFTPQQAKPFVRWAKRAGLNMISFWALQRDNGNCPGTAGSNVCSGVAQPTWAFSEAFAAFNPRHHGSWPHRR